MRRVFLSCQHRDQKRAKGFDLMSHNKNLKLDLSVRHLLDKVDSSNRDYITRRIKEQLNGTSATVVLIGKETAQSGWVKREIEWSRDRGNALVGIRIDPGAEIPAGLTEAGAEILDWNDPSDAQQFGPAVERAVKATVRAKNMPTNSESHCFR